MTKTFCITMFGEPFDWTQQYIDNVQHLEGWEWKIFTPNKFSSKGNVEIIPMTIEEYNNLVEAKLGVRPQLAIVKGKPNLHITDFYIFSGVVFEDYLKNSDFWGITNMDVIYGNLSKFISDNLLETCNVFSDDVQTINGVFSLFRNIPEINNLFRHILNWQEMITQPPCKGCIGKGKHALYGSDEYAMTEVVKNMQGFVYPIHYPMLSHDRLSQHYPKPQLEIKTDGSLFELFEDIKPVTGNLSRPYIGKEIPYFHFGRTKKWAI